MKRKIGRRSRCSLCGELNHALQSFAALVLKIGLNNSQRTDQREPIKGDRLLFPLIRGTLLPRAATTRLPGRPISQMPMLTGLG